MEAKKKKSFDRITYVIKKTAKIVLGGYIATYLACVGYAGIDYQLHHKKELLHKTKNEIVVRKFDLDLEGKIRHITLVGETHIYNQKETDFSRKLIGNNKLVLSEGSGGNKSFVSDCYFLGLSLIIIPSLPFYTMGNGRFITNDTLEFIAEDKKLPISYLEADTSGGFDDFTFSQKTRLTYSMLKESLNAPLAYHLGKKELSQIKTEKEKLDELDSDENKYTFASVKREDTMARKAIEYLKLSPESKVMIVVGKAHVRGIMANLGKYGKIIP